MTIFNYPLFCLALDREAVLGVVPGQDWQAVDGSVAGLKKTLTDWARKEAEQGLYWVEPEIDQARLKLITVKLRLAYKEKKGLYPLPQALPFKTAVVYGEHRDEGYRKAYLPLLEQEFYYYDPDQLGTLAEHFARDALDGLAPEQIYPYLLRGRPWLERLRVQVDDSPTLRRTDPALSQAQDRLRGIAERLPQKKARRRAAPLPDAAWERTALVARLVARFAKQPGNVLLVGEPGVGKTAVWLETIRRLHQQTRRGAADDTPPLGFWRSSAARLVADARYLGEWQQICETLVDDLRQANGVLWLVDVLRLLDTGGDGAEDSVAAFFLPLLQSGRLRLIGEAGAGEVDAARQRLPGFIASFTLIEVDELDRTQMQQVLTNLAGYARTNLRLTIAPEALTLGYSLLDRYLRYQCFPGKAMRFFADCLQDAKRQRADSVGPAEVVTAFGRATGLPELILRDELVLDKPALRDFFRQRIIGQDEAVERLCSLVAVYKTGLNDPDRPIATLLFAGPTGVGKTAAAQALAAFFFRAGQDRQPLFRVDMSEFQHPQQIGRLIGDPNQPGTLVRHVRDRPFSVLLLDEIEKADASFFDILLGVMDEGRLVDGAGRITDFRSCIVVMTSNLGAAGRLPAGFLSRPADAEREAARQFFRPEFYNRLDQLIVFRALDQATIQRIAAKELAELGRREGLVQRGLTLEFSGALVEFIGRAGFSPRYGARPLQRAVEAHVVGALSRFLAVNPQAAGGRLLVGLDERERVTVERC